MTFYHDTADNQIDLSSIHSAEDMLVLAADDKLKLEQLKTLIEIHPGIVQASVEAMQSLAKISESAANAQVASVSTLRSTISGSLEVLKILAQNAESDTTRERIAEMLLELAKQHKELCQMCENMNKNNNQLWKRIALGVTGAALLVVGGVAVAASMKE